MLHTEYNMLQHASLRCTQRVQHAATRYAMLQHAAFCGNMSRIDCSSRTSRVWPSEGGGYLPELSQACRFHVGMTSGGAEQLSGKAQRVRSAARHCALGRYEGAPGRERGDVSVDDVRHEVGRIMHECLRIRRRRLPQSLRRRGRARPSPGADVAVASPVAVPM
jgi:hypothetical protein